MGKIEKSKQSYLFNISPLLRRTKEHKNDLWLLDPEVCILGVSAFILPNFYQGLDVEREKTIWVRAKSKTSPSSCQVGA